MATPLISHAKTTPRWLTLNVARWVPYDSICPPPPARQHSAASPPAADDASPIWCATQPPMKAGQGRTPALRSQGSGGAVTRSNFRRVSPPRPYGGSMKSSSSVPVSTRTGLIGRSAFQYFLPAFAIRPISANSFLVRSFLNAQNARMAPGNIFARQRARSKSRSANDPYVLRGWRISWSGKRGSNPRHPPWQGGALPLSYSRSESGREG